MAIQVLNTRGTRAEEFGQALETGIVNLANIKKKHDEEQRAGKVLASHGLDPRIAQLPPEQQELVINHHLKLKEVAHQQHLQEESYKAQLKAKSEFEHQQRVIKQEETNRLGASSNSVAGHYIVAIIFVFVMVGVIYTYQKSNNS